MVTLATAPLPLVYTIPVAPSPDCEAGTLLAKDILYNVALLPYPEPPPVTVVVTIPDRLCGYSVNTVAIPDTLVKLFASPIAPLIPIPILLSFK